MSSKIHIIEHKRKNWHYERFRIDAWTRVHNSSFSDIDMPLLPRAVIAGWKIYVFLRTQNGNFISLPLRHYSTNAYTASIDVVVKPNVMRVIWTFNDVFEKQPSPYCEIAVFAINSKISGDYPEVNFRNFSEIQETFQLP